MQQAVNKQQDNPIFLREIKAIPTVLDEIKDAYDKAMMRDF